MLDLPELHDKVFQYLGRHDLTLCAQVSKKWHALTIPHLWRNLTCVCLGNARREAFGRFVLEDYLAEQRRQELQENGHELEQTPPSALLKYGPWIRLLPNTQELLEHVLWPQVRARQGNNPPTAHDLLLHFFKRCPPEAQVQNLFYQFKEAESDEMQSILAFTLPRLRSFDIRGSFQGTRSDFFRLKNVLGRCSTPLSYLYVDIDFQRPDDDKAMSMEDETAENGSICWTSLKNLALQHSPDTWDAGRFWSWMWKRCGQVERLYVDSINKSTPSLVQAMLGYMPHLREITLGNNSIIDQETDTQTGRNIVMTDKVVAALLSGSQHGWKAVAVKASAEIGKAAMNALANHYSTLEELEVDGNCHLPGRDVVQVLKSCAHLRSLLYTDLYSDWTEGNSVVNGKEFIDMDPETGLLRPWLCEGSLRILVVKIVGIPRPDLGMDGAPVEAYPGQGREIQGQVYDRLARLTHLETLWFGDYYYSLQNECLGLEVSLESGLDKLSGLKSLKEVGVKGMASNIGVKEVQWMVENWPKLSCIYGLDGYGGDEDAVQWMRENHPKIKPRHYIRDRESRRVSVSVIEQGAQRYAMLCALLSLNDSHVMLPLRHLIFVANKQQLSHATPTYAVGCINPTAHMPIHYSESL
ncbi:MAG: hypothetical protein J3Q66DRAFT_390949 [Benniella sp.]|nr:MAG: hypothetical protein J3Q66DRAFT_390949 [Benniella sp.]